MSCINLLLQPHTCFSHRQATKLLLISLRHTHIQAKSFREYKKLTFFWNKIYKVWSLMGAAGMLFTLAVDFRVTGSFSNEHFSSSSWNFCLAFFDSLMNILNCLLPAVLLLYIISPKISSQFMCYSFGKCLLGTVIHPIIQISISRGVSFEHGQKYLVNQDVVK